MTDLGQPMSTYGSDRQATAAADATSYTITGLENDTEYMVQVLATNRIGNSEPSTAAESPVCR